MRSGPKQRLGCCPEGMCIDFAWESMATAPKDRFILLYCAEDGSRWLAMWQGLRWHGVDELGLTREGHSAGDPDVVTGWAVNGWMDLPPVPKLDNICAETVPNR